METVEAYLETGIKTGVDFFIFRPHSSRTGESSIEQISRVYGAQAVVVSIDPKRVWIEDPSTCHHVCIKSIHQGFRFL